MEYCSGGKKQKRFWDIKYIKSHTVDSKRGSLVAVGLMSFSDELNEWAFVRATKKWSQWWGGRINGVVVWQGSTEVHKTYIQNYVMVSVFRLQI